MEIGLAAVLLTLAFLLFLISFIPPLAKKINLPETVIIAVLGIGLGSVSSLINNSMGLDLLEGPAGALLSFPINSEGFLLIFLPLLVFQGAMGINVRSLTHEIATVLLLAIVAVIVSTATIGFALYPFAQQSLVACLLLGAIVATTDPSAVAGIFREIGAAARLSRLVEGEALLNDAAAIAIFTILISAITAHHQISFSEACIDFLTSFAGAVIIGIAVARLALFMITSISGFPAAEITLSLILPYSVYILCDDILGFSGVVATASAGLTISAFGPSTFRPQTWRFLRELWEQIEFWASTLVFMLAAMLVPRMMIGITKWDFFLILIASLAGLIARAAVIFGLLPLLIITRLSPPVPIRFKTTMAWGGLRGAITLALALAVNENPHINDSITHFVGIVATGFVLSTLLINGTTLRSLVLFLKLDRLSPIDEALRNQIIGIGLSHVAQRVTHVSDELSFGVRTRGGVISRLEQRAEKEKASNNFETALNDKDRVNMALLTIANQERSLLLDLFRVQGMSSRRVIETLLRATEAIVDATQLEGRYGYVKTRRKSLQPSLRLRIAQMLHRRFHIDRPLTICMMERFETLIISHLVSTSLIRFVRERMEPTLGLRITEIVSEVLGRQRKLLDDALATLRLHYSGYSEALESRLLRQIALRLEDEEYATLAKDNLISQELHRELHKSIERQRNRLDTPLRFNLRSGIEQRLRSFPAFNGVPDGALHDLAGRVFISFLSPGEILIRKGERIRTIYAQVAGLVETSTSAETQEVMLGAGDLIGANSHILGKRAQNTVRSLQFSHMLAIPRADFDKLLQNYPIVKRQIMKRHDMRLNGALETSVVITKEGNSISPVHEAGFIISPIMEKS
ncbi:cation:proton antiporter [Bombella sp. TMW 2.2559]|uniref:Cation:proton antiporter n=1 Tax=Bombella dulcis TaxID=2967339 RepID=A0ABT3W9K5_9PROT|nr:cation:proton antiporter [Bombella dulcis]MCX5615774.1 cation:proton antiporter [Bombella dulcis]